MMKFIYRLTMMRSRKMIRKKYGSEFWRNFANESDKMFREVLKRTPDIGESVFSFNYVYAPSYVAWYKTMQNLGLDAKQADELMWRMNEKMLLTVPKPFLHMADISFSKRSLASFGISDPYISLSFSLQICPSFTSASG